MRNRALQAPLPRLLCETKEPGRLVSTNGLVVAFISHYYTQSHPVAEHMLDHGAGYVLITLLLALLLFIVSITIGG